MGEIIDRRRLDDHAKAQAGTPLIRGAELAVRRAAARPVVVPATPPDDAADVRGVAADLLRRNDRIDSCDQTQTVAIAVTTPLGDVSVHVVQPPVIRPL